MESSSLNVNVISIGGDTIASLSLCHTATVGDLQLELQKAVSVQFSQAHFVFGDVKLSKDEGKPLSSYGISDGSSVILVRSAFSWGYWNSESSEVNGLRFTKTSDEPDWSCAVSTDVYKSGKHLFQVKVHGERCQGAFVGLRDDDVGVGHGRWDDVWDMESSFFTCFGGYFPHCHLYERPRDQSYTIETASGSKEMTVTLDCDAQTIEYGFDDRTTYVISQVPVDIGLRFYVCLNHAEPETYWELIEYTSS